MDEQIKTRHRKKHFIDRIHLMDDEPVPVITRNKFSKIREKFEEPKTLVDEGIDGWGDDMEVDI